MDQAGCRRDPWGHGGQKQTWALPFSSGKMASGSPMHRESQLGPVPSDGGMQSLWDPEKGRGQWGAFPREGILS